MKRGTLLNFVGLATISVACMLRIFGFLGPAAFWFVLWLIATVQLAACLRMWDQSDRRWAALFASMMVQGVRCAGCHTAAVLASGQPAPTDDDGNVALPPGWVAFHDRPYCAACAAKAN
jgi:mono/diheme cytochrome c family protein